jgi:hypothetical protein
MASACGDLCTREPCNNRYCTAYDDEHRCRESQRSRDNESRDLRGLGPGRRNVHGKRGLSGKRFRSFVVSTGSTRLSCIPSNRLRPLVPLQLSRLVQLVRFAGGF